MTSSSTLRRQLRRQRLSLLCILGVLGAILAVFSLVDLNRVNSEEREKLITQASLVSANIELQMRSAALVLEETLATADFSTHEQHRERMQSLVNAMPSIRGLGILDRDGWHVTGTRPVGNHERYFGDRPYFRNVQNNPQRDRLYISQPFRLMNGQTSIALSKAMFDERNQFMGVAFAVIDPEYIEILMASTLYTPDMWAGLMHVESNDGLTVGTPPTPMETLPVTGRDLARSLPHLQSSGEGVFLLDLDDADDQLVAASTISTYAGNQDRPLIVLAGRSFEEAIASWRRFVITQALVFLGAAVAAAAGLLFYQHRRQHYEDRRRAAERLVQARENDYRIIVENTADCVVKLAPSGGYSYVNPAFCTLFGLTDPAAHRGNFFNLVSPDDESLAREELAYIADSSSEKRIQLRCQSPLGLRYMEWTFCSVPDDQDLNPILIGIGRDVTDYITTATKLRTLAQRDSLTGLANRRHFLETAAPEVEQAQRYGQPLSLLMIDLDHFKNVNDTWGHQGGDMALKHCARMLQNQCRETDLPARFGGEEFIVLLPNTQGDAAALLAERLRQTVATQKVDLENGSSFSLTASIGVATLAPNETLEKLIFRADMALYNAKQSGRNRVEIAAPAETSVT